MKNLFLDVVIICSGGEKIYTYLLKYEHEKDLYQLPIPPEEMITKYFTTNKKYETIGIGEISAIKDIGLREIHMTVILPNDLSLPFIQPKYIAGAIIDKPIVYLTKFREFKANKKPVQLLITRILPDGEEIFKGNILVTLEEYTVYEKAGENGDFIVELAFREYRNIEQKILKANDDTKNDYIVETNRTAKETAKTYTLKQGDTLWKIAKRELNDESLYKKIMEINNITDPKKLQIGTVLRLV